MNSNAKLILGLVAFLVAVIAITILIQQQAQNRIDQDTLAIFSDVPGEVAYTDINGNEISLEQYVGNVLVVATWASWSPYSVTDLPILAKLVKEFDSAEVTFLAINRKETKEQAARFLASMPDLSDLLLVLDPRDHFYTSVGGYAMPEVVIYNKRGEITHHFRGDAKEESINEAINQLLQDN
ncbi:MAG TPA: TlpA disulfide reductase family protein [Candidatus Paceibacterota bacterium]|nr:TlpA disulfide reductase family protein [Candidatus Paceibacterota bacterium]